MVLFDVRRVLSGLDMCWICTMSSNTNSAAAPPSNRMYAIANRPVVCGRMSTPSCGDEPIVTSSHDPSRPAIYIMLRLKDSAIPSIVVRLYLLLPSYHFASMMCRPPPQAVPDAPPPQQNQFSTGNGGTTNPFVLIAGSFIGIYISFQLMNAMFGYRRVNARHVDQQGRPVDPRTGRPLQ